MVVNPATNAGSYVLSVDGVGDHTRVVAVNWEITKAQATISGEDSISIRGIGESVSKTFSTNGDEAFSGCNALTTLTIPNSVQTIGKYAFNNCNVLATINLTQFTGGTAISLGADANSRVFYVSEVRPASFAVNFSNQTTADAFSEEQWNIA